MVDITSMILDNPIQEFVIRWYFVPNTNDAYCVGSDGSVWSRYVRAGGKLGWVIGGMDNWRRLSPWLNSKEYLHYGIRFDSGLKMVKAHRLVAEAFLGPCSPGLEVCHEDNNRQNNHVCNLRYDTHRNNQRDRIKHGNRDGRKVGKYISLTPMILDNQIQEFKVLWYYVPNTRDAYCVGSDGSVWSRYVSGGRGKGMVIGDNWRKLLPGPDGGGYAQYILRFNDRLKAVKGHRLVAEAFIGPRPPGLEVCHEDNNRQNNHACNLRYDTESGNQRDRLKHGTHLRGSHNPSAVLNEDLADQIRAEYANDVSCTYKQLGEKYGVSRACIGRVIRNRTYIPLDLMEI
jgi:hypothetical protein